MAEIKDFARMCNVERKHRGCFGCPLESLERAVENEARVARRKSQCFGMIHSNADEVDRIVTEWCEEHPEKTYAEDFLEKFPDATLEDGIPVACRKELYGRCECKFVENDDCTIDCKKCWNEVMSDA